MNRSNLSTDEDRAAWDLCIAVGAEPFQIILQDCERRFRGYEGEYFMNWARDKIDEAIAINRVCHSLIERT
jgi:hypothetical protein